MYHKQPTKGLQRTKEISQFYIARQTEPHYIHVLNINKTRPQIRELDSTIGHTWFILTLPGNKGDISVS